MNFAETVCIMVFLTLFAETGTFADEPERDYTPRVSGYASFEAGEIMRGLSSVRNINDHELFRTWLQTGYVGLRVDATVKEYLTVIVAGEAQTFISFLRTEGNMNDAFTESRQPRTVVSIKHGEGLLTLGDVERLQLQVEAGFFPYKYNPDTRNLGEFMFRTYAYPPSIVSEFDKPYADLTGLRVGGSTAAGPGHVTVDLLLTTSMNYWPFMNWSPSLLFDFALPRLFEAGGGIQWWNLIPVGVNNPKVVSLSDWSGESPTEPDSNSTFAGTKLMTRLALDFKGLLPERINELLGPTAFKLYGELAVLGLKNYDGPDTSVTDGYEKRLWRTPMMVGLNFPTHPLMSYTVAPALVTFGFRDKGKRLDAADFFNAPNLVAAGTGIVAGVGFWLLGRLFDLETGLDVLNLELEYQESPYPNSVYSPVNELKPVLSDKVYHAQWKVSVYAAKNIGEHVRLVFQVARDHLMPQSTIQALGYTDCVDVLLRPTDWWWTGKVRFDF